MKKFLALVLALLLSLSILAACQNEPEVEYNLPSASLYLHDDMKDRATQQAADFEVLGQVIIGGVTYPITWTVEPSTAATVTPSEDGKKAIIDINEKTEEEYSFTLKATITAGGESTERTYTFTVPAYNVASYDEYIAAEKDAALTVEGIVVGVASQTNGAKYNQIYLQDAAGKGGYYLYSLEKDPLTQGIEVGMTVTATGTKDIYSGTHELKNCTIAIVSSDKTPATPIDITAEFGVLSDKDLLAKYESALITIKGVEVTDQDVSDLATNGYLNFKLNDLTTYLRVGGSSLMITAAEQTQYIADQAAKRSWKADVTGVLTAYSGKAYLTAVTGQGFNYLEEIKKTDDEKIAEVTDTLAMDKIVADGEIELPTTGAYDATISWALADNAVATLADNKLTITRGQTATEIVLTATIKVGETTKTAEIKVEVAAALSTPEEIVNAAFGLAEDETLGTYTLSGVITEINSAYNDQYGNITVTIIVGDMDDKAIECFRLQGEGVDKLAVGDNITVTGTIKNYKGKVEFDAKCNLDAVKSAATIVEEAFALEKGAELGYYTLTGVITKVNSAWDDKYGNMTVTIKVGDKEIECYRMKGEGAKDLTDGTTISVYGKIKNYNGKIEFDAGCLAFGFEVASGPVADQSVGQDKADTPLFSICAPNNGAAQKFTPTFDTITEIKVWLGGALSAGKVTMKVGTELDDASVGSMVLDMATVGATADGFVSFVFETPLTVTAGQTYYFCVSAADTTGNLYVSGITSGGEGGHNYDLPNRGGWKEESGHALAYEVLGTNLGGGNEGGGNEEGGNTETPAPAAGNRADMETMVGEKDTSYMDRTSTNGWTATNAACLAKDFIGEGICAITLNGKTSAPGKLTSPALSGGIKSLSFKYGFPFGDTQFKITINIKKGDEVVATTTLEKTELTKETVYEYTWTLDAAVDGEFTIEIVNECLSGSSNNKDRLSIWDLTWENK